MALSDLALSCLYVPGCAACDGEPAAPADGELPAAMCLRCATSLVANLPACPRCAEPLRGPTALTCARCRRRPPPLDGTVAPWRYGGELATALRRLKFAGRSDVARTLAPLVAPFLIATARAAGIDLVVPVPLHWRRLFTRGFDQVELLIAHAAEDVPVVRALRRRRHTAPQTGKDAAARVGNVRDAFVVTRRARGLIADRRVLLVDDVITTGATIAAAALALRAAGAASIHGFAVARAET